MQLSVNSSAKNLNGKPLPPGRIKIVESLKTLLEEKDFGAITTAEIAKTAGVTEALIYKYFKDKRDLLHQILSEYLEQYRVQITHDLRGIKGVFNKLRKIDPDGLTEQLCEFFFNGIINPPGKLAESGLKLPFENQ